MAKCKVSADALAEVAAMFRAMGIAVVGSGSGANGIVVLEVEGAPIPDTDMVGCTIERIQDTASATLTARFEPA